MEIILNEELVKETGMDINELRDMLESFDHSSSDRSGDMVYDYDSIDDYDELAEKLGFVSYHIVEKTSYGNSKIEVMMFNQLSEDWEHSASYHADIEELSEFEPAGYSTREEAIGILDSWEEREDQRLAELEKNATEEEIAAYEEAKSNSERLRNAAYGYAKMDGDLNGFRKLYPNDSTFPSLGEWLDAR